MSLTSRLHGIWLCLESLLRGSGGCAMPRRGRRQHAHSMVMTGTVLPVGIPIEHRFQTPKPQVMLSFHRGVCWTPGDGPHHGRHPSSQLLDRRPGSAGREEVASHGARLLLHVQGMRRRGLGCRVVLLCDRSFHPVCSRVVKVGFGSCLTSKGLTWHLLRLSNRHSLGVCHCVDSPRQAAGCGTLGCAPQAVP